MIDLEESSLADIVSNVLAVLMLVTVMALLGAGGALVSQTPGIEQGSNDTDVSFLEPSRSPLPAFTRYYIVTEEGIAVLLSERIADALAAEPGAYAGEAQALEGSPATVSFELDRFGGPGGQSYLNAFEVDLAQFRLKLKFPKGPLVPTMGWDPAETLVGRIVQRTRSERRGPTFLVTRSGFDRFAALYDGLARRGICFRWLHLADDMELTEYRNQRMFANFDFRRCTFAS
ncbi:MAG: hypothetical protein ACREC6_10030 [Hyphomicrobiaceae bacterium]